MQRIIITAVAALLALPVVLTAAALPETGSAHKGVDFIRSTQQPDGGFGALGQTMDAVFAIRAAGIDPNTVTSGGKSPADFLLASTGELTTPAAAGKAALGARALTIDPRNVGGTDLISIITASYDQATGAYADDDFSQSIAILGLACTGNGVGELAVDALRTNQLDDGGWGFGGFSDADTTAIVIQAMLAAGVPTSDEDVVKAIAYLRASQNDDGGWGYGGESNTSSTAYVVQALLAAGEGPESATYTKNGATPVSYLVALQQADGSFPGFDPAFATNQVVPALAARTFCSAVTTAIQSTVPVATPTATPAQNGPPAPPATGTGLAGGQPLVALVIGLGVLFLAFASGLALRGRP
jgi:prenyltransferase beta subunit